MKTGPRWQFGLGRENGLAFWGMTFLEGSFAAYIPIWPLFIQELGAPIALVGVLLGLNGVFRLFVLLPTAAIARRIGGKRLLIACRLIGAASVGLAAVIPGWVWLIPLLVGISIGSMAFPIVLSLLAAHAGERRQRVRAFSLVVTIGPSIAFLVAPLISSGLISIFGIRAPFVASVVYSLISVLIFTRISGEEASIEEEGATDAGVGYRAAFSIPIVRNILILTLATVFSLALGTQLLPNYLRDTAGYSDDFISLVTALSALGTIAFGTLVVRNQRFSSAPLLGAAIAAGSVGIGFLILLQPAIVAFVVIGFLLRGGMFASVSMFSAMLGDAAPARLRQHIFTVSEIFIVSGISFAPMVAGLFYEIWPALPLVLAATLIVPIVVILLRLNASTQIEVETEPATSP